MSQWGLDEIPEKTEQSIGQPKQDVPNPPKPYNPVFDQNAPTFENLKTSLIDQAKMLGKANGGTPGSFASVHPNIIGTYGAVADALIWNGSALVWNPTPTNIVPMMQAAADAGGYCLFPGPRGVPGDADYCSGNYFIDIPLNVVSAVRMQKRCHWVAQEGSVFWVRGAGTNAAQWRPAIMIESVTESSHVIEGFAFNVFGGAARSGALAYIVVHAYNVRITPRAMYGGSKWNVIVESGYAQNMEAGTYLPSGSYINSNFWRVAGWTGRTPVGYAGTAPVQPAAYDPVGGASVYAHGPDSQGKITDILSEQSNAGFHLATLAPCALYDSYGEFNTTFGVFEGASTCVAFQCGSEDLLGPVLANGSLATYGTGTVTGATHFGYLAKFISGDAPAGGTAYYQETPYPPYEAYNLFWRVPNGGNPLPPLWMLNHHEAQKSTRLSIHPDGNSIPGWDGSQAGIEWTNWDHSRGPGLVWFGRPTLNSDKRFCWSQAATIPANGSLVVQMKQAWANKITLLATDPTMYDPTHGLEGAHTRVSAQVEIASADPLPTFQYANNAAGDAAMTAALAVLTASKVRVGATMRLAQDKTGGVWAVQVFNDDGSDVNVTVWWTAEMVQYAAAGAGP